DLRLAAVARLRRDLRVRHAQRADGHRAVGPAARHAARRAPRLRQRPAVDDRPGAAAGAPPPRPPPSLAPAPAPGRGGTVACFLLTALLLTRVHVRETPPEPSTDAFLRQAGAGFRHLAATSPLGAVTVLTSAAFAATAMLNVAVFPVIEHGLQLPTASLGVLVSLQGVGAVVAGATAATVIGRR